MYSTSDAAVVSNAFSFSFYCRYGRQKVMNDAGPFSRGFLHVILKLHDARGLPIGIVTFWQTMHGRLEGGTQNQDL